MSDPAATPPEFIQRYVAYITADGFGKGPVITRLERLEFEAIVREKSCAEVLAGLDEPS